MVQGCRSHNRITDTNHAEAGFSGNARIEYDRRNSMTVMEPQGYVSRIKPSKLIICTMVLIMSAKMIAVAGGK